MSTQKKVFINVFIITFLVILPFIAITYSKIRHGYNAAKVEEDIRKNCNCDWVKELDATDDQYEINFSPGSKLFLELEGCEYENIENLKDHIINVLIENKDCNSFDYKFVIKNFKGKEEHFGINNCMLKTEE